MRSLNLIPVLIFTCTLAIAQVPLPDASESSSSVTLAIAKAPPLDLNESSSGVTRAMAEDPLLAQPVTRMQQMKNMIKLQVNRAIDGKPYPSLVDWQPLTARQKFDVFLHSTYSPRTFFNVALDEAADRAKGNHLNREYEKGFRGVGQRYGVSLATNETDVFFQRFLFPTLLKQDPRYFRNPGLPFFQRALYAMSRVLITRTDSGGQAFNSSRILSVAASRAVSDLYVPGERQGMHPIGACVSFTLLRDAGENLLHEFWPDVRRKFLHR
ncbi:MAG TPA: hypothetical protein VNZ47_05320 [Candidatus Dormibacteraeota bacterium]|jgi:hypothetical protein|nr:hypothetical protein [Candidatus Dormibacteraeota bacterium]